ncbi:hypothetical protein OKW22_000087 [Bacilli bacterium PM5-3]|nr:hypothetical protein [Bacilli bacterium PM5-3]
MNNIKILKVLLSKISLLIILVQSLVLVMLFSSISTSYIGMKRQIIDTDEPNYIDFRITEDINVRYVNELNKILDNKLFKSFFVVKSDKEKVEYQYIYIPNNQLNNDLNRNYIIRNDEAISSSVIYENAVLEKNQKVSIDDNYRKVVNIDSYANISNSDNTLSLKYNSEVIKNNKIIFIRVYLLNELNKSDFFKYVNVLESNNDLQIIDYHHYSDLINQYFSEGNVNSIIILTFLIIVLSYIYIYILNLRKKNVAILQALGITKFKLKIFNFIEIILLIISSFLFSIILYSVLHIMFSNNVFFNINFGDILVYGGNKILLIFIILELVIFSSVEIATNKGSISLRYKE